MKEKIQTGGLTLLLLAGISLSQALVSEGGIAYYLAQISTFPLLFYVCFLALTNKQP